MLRNICLAVILLLCFGKYAEAEIITVTETVVEIETGTRLVEEEYQEEVIIETTITETVVDTVTEEVVTENTYATTQTIESANMLGTLCSGEAAGYSHCFDTNGDGVADTYKATYYYTSKNTDYIDLQEYISLQDTFELNWGIDVWNNCPQSTGGSCSQELSAQMRDVYNLQFRLLDSNGNIVDTVYYRNNKAYSHGWKTLEDTLTFTYNAANDSWSVYSDRIGGTGSGWSQNAGCVNDPGLYNNGECGVGVNTTGFHGWYRTNDASSLSDIAGGYIFMDGIDSGYWGGYYGPRFRNDFAYVSYDEVTMVTEYVTSLVTTYVEREVERIIEETVWETRTRLVEEQYEYEVERIITYELEVPDAPTTDTSVPEIDILSDLGQVEVEVTNESGDVVDSFTIDVSDLNAGSGFESNVEVPELEVTSVDTNIETMDTTSSSTDVEVETSTVESTVAEVEAEIESTLEADTSVAEVESTDSDSSSDSEADSESDSESDSDTEVADNNQDDQEQNTETTQTVTAVERAKQDFQRRQAIATEVAVRVMQRFQDNYYSGLAQATQIALINAIAEGGEYDSYESVYLPDSAEWYESIQIYPNQMLEDPYAQYYSEANDRRWNEMVDEQYEEE